MAGSALHLIPKQPMNHVGSIAATVVSVGVPLAVIATGGLAGALLLAKHKVLGALLGGTAGVVAMGLWDKAHAAQAPALPTTCADGTPAPGGNTAACPPPKMGNNDPDAPPGGWAYNAPVAQPSALQQAAQALAKLDPCNPASEQAVRNFQAAAGLAQINGGPGWNAVSPPGTDGRYGGDTALALAKYVPNAPPACYSNSNPTRPGWWGPPGTYANPGAAAHAASA